MKSFLVLSSLLLLFLEQPTPTRGLCGSTFLTFLPSSLSNMSSHTITTALNSNRGRKGGDLNEKLVLITGANKGIGKEIARLIGSTPGYCVLLACRNVALGIETANELRCQPSPLEDFYDDEDDDNDDNDDDGEIYQQQQQQQQDRECNVIALPYSFDLTNIQSIQTAAKYIQENYGPALDVLINNAAICYNDPTLYGKTSYTPFVQQAAPTIQTNYFGTKHVIDTFLPLLLQSNNSPRIINMASYAGRLTILNQGENGKHLRNTFTSNSLTSNELSTLMSNFVTCVQSNTHIQAGWPSSCYGVSKLGIIALTRVLAKQYPNIMSNSVDPGYCCTDQNNNRGTVSPVRGARTAYLLALMERSYDDDDNDRDNALEYDNEEGEEEEDGDEVTESNHKADSGLHFYEESEISWSYD